MRRLTVTITFFQLKNAGFVKMTKLLSRLYLVAQLFCMEAFICSCGETNENGKDSTVSRSFYIQLNFHMSQLFLDVFLKGDLSLW